MLSIQDCRKLITDNDKYTDNEIVQIRDDLYTLADIAIGTLSKKEK